MQIKVRQLTDRQAGEIEKFKAENGMQSLTNEEDHLIEGIRIYKSIKI